MGKDLCTARRLPQSIHEHEQLKLCNDTARLSAENVPIFDHLMSVAVIIGFRQTRWADQYSWLLLDISLDVAYFKNLN